MSQSLSYLILNYWGKREVHINTDYSVTGWMLCVITHIYNDAIDNSYGNDSKQFKNVTNKIFMAHLMMNFMVPQTFFGVRTLTSIEDNVEND